MNNQLHLTWCIWTSSNLELQTSINRTPESISKRLGTHGALLGEANLTHAQEVLFSLLEPLWVPSKWSANCLNFQPDHSHSAAALKVITLFCNIAISISFFYPKLLFALWMITWTENIYSSSASWMRKLSDMR